MRDDTVVAAILTQYAMETTANKISLQTATPSAAVRRVISTYFDCLEALAEERLLRRKRGPADAIRSVARRGRAE
jgi:hypothetical protein